MSRTRFSFVHLRSTISSMVRTVPETSTVAHLVAKGSLIDATNEVGLEVNGESSPDCRSKQERKKINQTV
jgi:hypothetical protein